MTPRRLLALALGLWLVPATTSAKGLDPDAAAARRAEQIDAQPDAPRAAIDHLRTAAEELGDPELFLTAAEVAEAEADRARDEELAREAAALARISEDIALHLADERNFDVTDWRPVTRERAASLAVQASALASEAEQLAETIVAERAAAEAEARRLAEADADAPERQRRPGTGMIAGGAAMLTIGVGGLGMIGAGVALGQARQRDAEALLLPEQIGRLAELDRQGAQANVIAFAGIGVATVGIAVGAALIAVGVKKRRAAGEGESEATALERMQVGGWVDRAGGGAVIGGRF